MLNLKLIGAVCAGSAVLYFWQEWKLYTERKEREAERKAAEEKRDAERKAEREEREAERKAAEARLDALIGRFMSIYTGGRN